MISPQGSYNQFCLFVFNPPLLGKREQQEVEVLEEKMASGPGSSDRRGYTEGAEGEAVSVLTTFFSFDTVSSNF